MTDKLSQADNVAILREAIGRFGFKCHISPDEGLFKFKEPGMQAVFYFPKKNRYRLAGDPTDHFANAHDFLAYYRARPEMRNFVVMPPAPRIACDDTVSLQPVYRDIAQSFKLPVQLMKPAMLGLSYFENLPKDGADSGECESCIDGKCKTGPKCVTLGRDNDDNQGAAPCSSN